LFCTDLSSPQIPNIERAADVPTEDVLGWILPDTNPMIINVLKIPTPDNSSDDSGEETGG
jgi:hypothetical protein